MEPSRPGSVDDGQRPLPGQATTAQVAALYDQHAAAMLGLALRILGDRNEAEEVLEEVFLYVWEHVNELGEKPASHANWLLKTTRNLCLARLRRRPPPTSPPSSVLRFAQEGRGAGSEGKEQPARRVREALESLPQEQRQVIELLYFQGLSRREVAARLGYPDETVLAYARLGLQQLQEALLTAGAGMNDANE